MKNPERKYKTLIEEIKYQVDYGPYNISRMEDLLNKARIAIVKLNKENRKLINEKTAKEQSST